MGRIDRLILLLLVLVLVAWRFTRFMRLGMAKRRPSLGIAGGWFPPDSKTAATEAAGSTPSDRKRPLIRVVVALVIIVIWLIGNLLIWLFLLESPFLKSVPPIVLGVVGIFANFYLIPFARRTGDRLGDRLARGAKSQ